MTKVFNVNVYSLFVGFLVGVMIMTTIADKPTIVIKHPTPYNTSKITYVDKTGTCYKYKANEVSCPMDGTAVKEIPVNI